MACLCGLVGLCSVYQVLTTHARPLVPGGWCIPPGTLWLDQAAHYGLPARVAGAALNAFETLSCCIGPMNATFLGCMGNRERTLVNAGTLSLVRRLTACRQCCTLDTG